MRAFLCLGMFVSVRHRVMDGGSLEFSKLLSTLCEHSVKVVWSLLNLKHTHYQSRLLGSERDSKRDGERRSWKECVID